MKNAFILILFLLFSSVMFGQDQIISRTGIVINCKVIKTEGNLVYFDSTVDSTVVRRCIAKTEISKIRYGLGKELKIADIDTAKAVTSDTGNTDTPGTASIVGNSSLLKKRIKYYFTAGFNLSSYRGSTYDLGNSDVDNRTYRFFPISFGAGVIASMSESVSLQAGVEYVPKGVRFQNHFAWKFADRLVYKTNYIETPFSLQFSPSELKSVNGNSFYLRGGISPAFMVTSKIVDKSDYGETQDFKKTNRFDVCTFLGIGYRLQDQIAVEFRYEEGSKNIGGSLHWDEEEMLLYNRSMSLTASYLF